MIAKDRDGYRLHGHQGAHPTIKKLLEAYVSIFNQPLIVNH
jgi:hypothetical protein